MSYNNNNNNEVFVGRSFLSLFRGLNEFRLRQAGSERLTILFVQNKNTEYHTIFS